MPVLPSIATREEINNELSLEELELVRGGLGYIQRQNYRACLLNRFKVREHHKKTYLCFLDNK